MKYIEAITDRTQTDITNKTAKAYFNIIDWRRIDNNSRVAKLLVDFILSINVTFNAVIEPTITTIPAVTDINELLENIESLRLSTIAYPITGVVEIKDDYAEGIGVTSPDFENANSWENNIHLIYCGIGTASGYTAWIPPSATPVRRARANVATCGAGATRQNYFRRYA